ncbi:lactate racemase domain-containing protein [Luteococcus sp. H138]|uniref:lactate racemase domain-containing protein n=1 Tax=unclassified Luteococcus TaxID=2639923 RepID=UPI00313E585E
MTSMSENFRVESLGGPHQHVTNQDFEAFVEANLARADVDGKKVVLVVPDGTRSMPLPMVLKVVHRCLSPRVAELTAVIALGTHSYMEPDEIDRWFGVGGEGQPATLDEAYPGMRVVNHEWQDPDQIVKVGTLSAETIKELSQGAQDMAVDVEINRHVVEADVNIVIGPVFPHEVVGISGGNKYFIPGCATHDAIDLSHWVGALLGVEKVIGTTGITPMRAIINAGTDLIQNEKLALCLVVESGSGELEAAAFGTSEDSWAAMAEVAAQSHITWVDEPFQRVIACMPTRYDDIWTAAKGCYKAQPAMADGGEVIIHAPHVTEVSEVHHEIYEIGYHCIEYFTKQWDRFKDVPKGVLAHSTHVRGAGSYDAETGVETNRIKVTLATKIPREVCEQVNLGYLDPDSLDLEAEAKAPGTLVVPNAGEILFKLK